MAEIIRSNEDGRVIVEKFADAIMTAEPSAVAHKAGEMEGVRFASSSHEGLVDELPSGQVRYDIKGPSPQGETQNLEVCRHLIAKLNQSKVGPPWRDCKVLSGSYIDAEASDGTDTLRIQITRAEQKLWEDLANLGAVKGTPQKIDALADALWEAIEDKAHLARGKERIVLALNALLSPGHAFQVVVNSFSARYGDRARQLGFHEIWVVGPTPELTKRLD